MIDPLTGTFQLSETVGTDFVETFNAVHKFTIYLFCIYYYGAWEMVVPAQIIGLYRDGVHIFQYIYYMCACLIIRHCKENGRCVTKRRIVSSY